MSSCNPEKTWKLRSFLGTVHWLDSAVELDGLKRLDFAQLKLLVKSRPQELATHAPLHGKTLVLT